jgi:hypothetical protein
MHFLIFRFSTDAQPQAALAAALAGAGLGGRLFHMAGNGFRHSGKADGQGRTESGFWHGLCDRL